MEYVAIEKSEYEQLLGDLAKVDAGIEQIRGICRPVLNGEHYLSGEVVCKALRITKRTLQQYRDDGLVSYVAHPKTDEHQYLKSRNEPTQNSRILPPATTTSMDLLSSFCDFPYRKIVISHNSPTGNFR